MFRYLLLLSFFVFMNDQGLSQSSRVSADSILKIIKLEEQKALDIFKPNREFHRSLRYQSAGLNEYPYNRLDSLMLAMKGLADEAIILSKTADSLSKFTSSIWATECYMKEAEIKYVRSQLKAASNSYQSTIASAGVTRTTNPRMIELMGKRVKQWQDSLVLQGRIIAESKLDLKKRFPEQTGSEFMKAYAPLSEMEANHKRFQTLLVQLENMQSRFEEMNNDVDYFSGPGIQPAQEVLIVDQLLGQFVLEMKAFRDQNKRYYSQFN